MAESLLQIVDAALASAVGRSGPHLACRPGCAQCCHGVFQIPTRDAERLREGLAQAPPDLQTRIYQRLAAAHVRLAPFFPGDPSTGTLATSEDAIELFEEWAHADPCPILDPATQTCDLYAHRPILCRTFGPPIRNDPDDLAAGLAICELCFTQASEADIAAAEFDSAFRRIEPADPAPTFIAFAFPTQTSDPCSSVQSVVVPAFSRGDNQSCPLRKFSPSPSPEPPAASSPPKPSGSSPPTHA